MFAKYHMKHLSGDFSAKIGREDIFKPTVGNENVHEMSNYSGVRIVHFATSKNPIFKSTMFSLHNINICVYIYIYIYIYILGHLKIGKPTIRLTIF
jgi:hypothetical protein